MNEPGNLLALRSTACSPCDSIEERTSPHANQTVWKPNGRRRRRAAAGRDSRAKTFYVDRSRAHAARTGACADRGDGLPQEVVRVGHGAGGSGGADHDDGRRAGAAREIVAGEERTHAAGAEFEIGTRSNSGNG